MGLLHEGDAYDQAESLKMVGIAATRRLTIDDGTNPIEVPIQIGVPEPSDRSWVCHFVIGWPEGAREDSAAGFDAAQALYLAMRKIASELYMSAYHQAGTLKWTTSGGGYGFPISPAARDLLVGEDRNL